MGYRGIVLVLALTGVAWLGPAASAQGQQAPAAPGHGARMEGLATIGPGLLHEHMEAMVKPGCGRPVAWGRSVDARLNHLVSRDRRYLRGVREE